jgi:hypothetical protein
MQTYTIKAVLTGLAVCVGVGITLLIMGYPLPALLAFALALGLLILAIWQRTDPDDWQ